MTRIIWSDIAIQELDQILEYWYKRNKSYNYSSKILCGVDDAVNLIKSHSGIGVETNHRNVKMRLVLNRFYLAYRIDDSVIEILKFWDCRQSPDSNPFIS